jgi:hypothetical protein
MNTETTTPKPVKTIDQLTEVELENLLAEKRSAKKKALSVEKDQHEADKNNFLKHSSSKFLQIHNEMKELKEYAILHANELYDRMFLIEGKDPKETKSFSLKNTADTVKVTVDRQERFSFNDEAIVHINAIKEIFKTKFAPRNKGLYNILDSLLIKGSGGEYDPKLLAKARRQVRELGDDNLMGEFDKLDGCQRVTSTALYCRLYIKDEKGKYQDISLQFSSL